MEEPSRACRRSDWCVCTPSAEAWQAARPLTLMRRSSAFRNHAKSTLVIGGRVANSFSSTHRVVLVAQTPMMALVAGEVWEVIREDLQFRGWLAMPPAHQAFARSFSKAQGLEIYPHYARVRWKWWDLALLPDHVTPFPRSVKTVQIPHGLARSSKIVAGHDYSYGTRRVLRDDGAPAYSLILEQSETVRDDVLQRLPQLWGHVIAVGDLRADRVLRSARLERNVRRSLGFSPTDRIVIIASTFGPDSLMERWGMAMIDEARYLANDRGFRIVLVVHPNLWESNTGKRTGWDRYFESIRSDQVTVLSPVDDFAPFLGIADIAVSDHTSISLGVALAGKPVVFIPLPAGTIAPDSPVAELMSVSKQLSDPSNLRATLEASLATRTDPRAELVARRYISHLGEASTRTRQALYELLGLKYE